MFLATCGSPAARFRSENTLSNSRNHVPPSTPPRAVHQHGRVLTETSIATSSRGIRPAVPVRESSTSGRSKRAVPPNPSARKSHARERSLPLVEPSALSLVCVPFVWTPDIPLPGTLRSPGLCSRMEIQPGFDTTMVPLTPARRFFASTLRSRPDDGDPTRTMNAGLIRTGLSAS